MADFMPNIIKPLSTTAGRTVFVNSLKKALTSLPLHEIELISQVNTTPIDVLPRASVLAPLYISPENEKWMLLTVRTEFLSHHPGEVCFPGGKREFQDVSDIDTSLREASEELGVNIEEHVDEIIGVLPPTLAKHELLVVPVLALMKGYPPPFFAVSNSEVAKTFIVPLDKFLQSKFHSTFEGIIKSKWSPRPHQQHPFRVHTFNIEDTCGESVPIIWGMTAQILIQISQLLYPDRKSEFQFEPPEGPSYSELAQAYFKFKINSAK